MLRDIAQSQHSVTTQSGWDGVGGGREVQEGGDIHILMADLILEKEMATHSSTLAWRIPWLEEPSRLQSMGSQRVRLDRGTFTFHEMSRAFQWLSGKDSACNAGDTGGTWQPTAVFLPGKSHRQGSLVGYSPWCCRESDTTELTDTIHEINTTHEINHQIVCKHSSGLILRLLLCAPECTGLPQLTDKEYFQMMHNSKEYHSLSSPDRTVLSHRAGCQCKRASRT